MDVIVLRLVGVRRVFCLAVTVMFFELSNMHLTHAYTN